MIDYLLTLESVHTHLVTTAGHARPLRAGEVGLLVDAALRAEEMIRREWPVKTGASRDGWRVYVAGLGLRFVNIIDYAEFVHFAGEVHTAWAEAFSLVDEFIVDPLLVALKAAITRNEAQSQQRPAFAQRTLALGRSGTIRLTPAGFGGGLR
jgi:hypothetical protein